MQYASLYEFGLCFNVKSLVLNDLGNCRHFLYLVTCAGLYSRAINVCLHSDRIPCVGWCTRWSDVCSFSRGTLWKWRGSSPWFKVAVNHEFSLEKRCDKLLSLPSHLCKEDSKVLKTSVAQNQPIWEVLEH